MRKKNNQVTAAQRVSSIFEEEISNAVINKYGGSYTTYEETYSNWRKTFPYNKEIENFLISEAKTYIRSLDSRKPESTNPKFLGALVTFIANFLSLYTMRSENTNTRKKARKDLEEKLYTNFSYIRNLIARQEAARDVQDKAKRNTYKRPARLKQKQLLENAKRTFTSTRNCVLVMSTNTKIH